MLCRFSFLLSANITKTLDLEHSLETDNSLPVASRFYETDGYGVYNTGKIRTGKVAINKSSSVTMR